VEQGTMMVVAILICVLPPPVAPVGVMTVPDLGHRFPQDSLMIPARERRIELGWLALETPLQRFRLLDALLNAFGCLLR
jgi:hypothetical protein